MEELASYIDLKDLFKEVRNPHQGLDNTENYNTLCLNALKNTCKKLVKQEWNAQKHCDFSGFKLGKHL